ALLLFTAALPSMPAQAAAARDFTDIDTIVNTLIAMYHIPGVALALVQNGQVIYTKGYGYRDYVAKLPVTPKTVFSIGSITKSFTGLDIAQLVDAGKIDLDTPVIKYLPDFKLSDPDATKVLTVREVISHSSGLPRSDISWYTRTPASRAAVIADMAKIPLTAK